jgi:NAD(P)H-nitrite reductase large subunit
MTVPSSPLPPLNSSSQHPEPKEEYPICTCFQVWESTVERAVRKLGLTTVEEIQRATQAGCGCHTCWPDLEEILARCARGEYKFPLEDGASESSQPGTSE